VIWNPWRRIRELEIRLGKEACEHAYARREIDALERALQDSVERYDRIRDANHQLRECLALYRTEGSA
jgi:ABC-type transporter lipoprotein component MlaA